MQLATIALIISILIPLFALVGLGIKAFKSSSVVAPQLPLSGR